MLHDCWIGHTAHILAQRIGESRKGAARVELGQLVGLRTAQVRPALKGRLIRPLAPETVVDLLFVNCADLILQNDSSVGSGVMLLGRLRFL